MGSEMCIRDRCSTIPLLLRAPAPLLSPLSPLSLSPPLPGATSISLPLLARLSHNSRPFLSRNGPLRPRAAPLDPLSRCFSSGQYSSVHLRPPARPPSRPLSLRRDGVAERVPCCAAACCDPRRDATPLCVACCAQAGRRSSPSTTAPRLGAFRPARVTTAAGATAAAKSATKAAACPSRCARHTAKAAAAADGESGTTETAQAAYAGAAPDALLSRSHPARAGDRLHCT